MSAILGPSRLKQDVWSSWQPVLHRRIQSQNKNTKAQTNRHNPQKNRKKLRASCMLNTYPNYWAIPQSKAIIFLRNRVLLYDMAKNLQHPLASAFWMLKS